VELFIVIIIFGVLLYELYTGSVITRYGTGANAISRETNPAKYWIFLAGQAILGVIVLLVWLGIIKF
jgi:hypothetical protein